GALRGALLIPSVTRPAPAPRDAAGSQEPALAPAPADSPPTTEAAHAESDNTPPATMALLTVERLLGAIDQIAFVSDEDGRLRMVNAATTERLGWTPGELLGRSIRDLMRDDDGSRICTLIAKGGTTRSALCTPRTLNDSNGRLSARVWVARETAAG